LNQNYPRVIKFLRGLKGLTESEAKAFFEICTRESVSVKEVMKIFTDLKIDVSRTKAYSIVDKYRKEGLIFPISDSVKTQRFKAIHPKALFNELKTSLDKLDIEIAQLSESYEISDFEVKDPRKLSKTLNSEGEIISVCNVLCRDSELFVISNETPELKDFYKALSDTCKIVIGDINLILFNNHDREEKGVITLTKRVDKKGHLRIFGQIIYDDDKFDYFYGKEVKRGG
jgi:sugar-specific transcriptional regulator TrmB